LFVGTSLDDKSNAALLNYFQIFPKLLAKNSATMLDASPYKVAPEYHPKTL
jgi:hypothetical protein